MAKTGAKGPKSRASRSTWSFVVDEQPTGLTRDRIVDAGVQLADREGLEAVSMRRLATELHASPMALYHYIPSKLDLLNLMLDKTYAGFQFPSSTDENWSETFKLFAWQHRKSYEEHKWVIHLPVNGRQHGPEAMRVLEWHLRKLDQFGIEISSGVRMLGILVNFVIGFVSNERDDPKSDARTEVSPALFSPEVLATGQFPYVEAFLSIGVEPPTDKAFARALESILTGLAAEMPHSTIQMVKQNRDKRLGSRDR